ncbi:MAG: hypothetical protein ABR501_02780 [Pyrinomonadaceae bacterium]
MNCPPLTKEIGDLLLPICARAQHFNGLPVDHLSMTTGAGVVSVTTGTRVFHNTPASYLMIWTIRIQVNGNLLTSNTTTVGDRSAFLSLGVLIGDGVLIGPEAINQ